MPLRDYDRDLLKRLAAPGYAAKYLQASFDGMLDDGDFSAFLLALRNVIRAQKGVSASAKRANITRQHLHRLLSGKGNPTLETLTAVLKTAGLTIDFRPLTRRG